MRKIIVVDGCIGVRKTIFVTDIAKTLDLVPFHEQFKTNPYLEDFYRSPEEFAYESQKWFIEDRLRSYKEAVEMGENCNVLVDRPPSASLIFTTALHEGGTLSREEYDGLVGLYDKINKGIRGPDLYIYLDATPERCLESIKARGIEMKQSITVDYLRLLKKIWDAKNDGLFECPMITVNWEKFGG